jgi:dTDP-4-dehydrorhamnose reductase
MRVLVVGSTGTIGKTLTAELSQSGFEVISASRRTNSDIKNSIHIDLTTASEALAIFEKQENFDSAVLCAAVTNLHECECDPKATSQINISAQVTLTKALLDVGTQKVVFLSSNRVFGGKSANTSKSAKYSFTTEYGRQKAIAETELLKLGKAVRVIRLTKVLAEDEPRLNDWASKLTSGREVKAFVDARVSPVTLDDTVKVITEVVESDCESVTQFSATDEISYFEMARFMAKFLRVDERLVVAQNAEEVGEKPLDHASLECSKFKSVNPSSSLVAVQKVLEKMIY